MKKTLLTTAVALAAAGVAHAAGYSVTVDQSPVLAGDTVTLTVVSESAGWAAHVGCKQSGKTVFSSWRYPSGGVPTYTMTMNRFHNPARDARCEATLEVNVPTGVPGLIEYKKVAGSSFTVESAP